MQHWITFGYSTTTIFIGFFKIRAVLNTSAFNRGYFKSAILKRAVFNRAINSIDLETKPGTYLKQKQKEKLAYNVLPVLWATTGNLRIFSWAKQ